MTWPGNFLHRRCDGQKEAPPQKAPPPAATPEKRPLHEAALRRSLKSLLFPGANAFLVVAVFEGAAPSEEAYSFAAGNLPGLFVLQHDGGRAARQEQDEGEADESQHGNPPSR